MDQAFSSIDVGNYTAALISQADGKYLVGEFAAKSDLKVSFPQIGGSKNIPSSAGGLMVSNTIIPACLLESHEP